MARARPIFGLLLAAGACVLQASSASAATPHLLADLVTGPGVSGSSIPNTWIEAGEVTFFIASRLGLGEEFFATDGTAAGTRLLADSSPGASSPDPVPYGVLSGRLLWWAFAPWRHPSRIVGTLWSSDGTVEGTDQLLPGGVSIPDPKHVGFVFAEGYLYFVACEVESCSIWKSDGTSAGTRPVHPISGASGAEEIAAAAGRIFFTTDEGMWAVDPTTGGATLVVETGEASKPPFELLGRGTLLFFAFAAEGRGEQIWTSDGTPEGTGELSSFSGAVILGMREGPGSLVYFVLRDFAEGTEIWKTDGTWAGTAAVTAFPHPGALDFDSYDELLILGERVFVPARSASSSAHLRIWVSDGSPESTRALVPCEEDCPDAAGPLVAAGGRVLFALRSLDRIELWSSDGTPAETGPVAELCEHQCALVPVVASEHGTQVGITAAGAAWISDGTREGTRPIHDPEVVRAVLPGDIGRAGGCWLFAGDDGRGVEPWCSEGKPGSARILADLEVRSRGSDPKDLQAVGSLAVFSARDESGFQQVWSSDGNPGSVKRLTSTPDSFLSSARDLFGAGGFVLFREPAGDPFLWRTDGTRRGTWGIGDLLRLSPQVALDGRAYALGFGIQGEPTGIWEIDGSPTGPRLVVPLPSSALGSLELAAAGGAFYYRGLESAELWRSDGTEQGTWQVLPPSVEVYPRLGAGLVELDGYLYFAGFSPEGGEEIWRTDGTPGSAQSVGATPTVSSRLHVHDGAAYFKSDSSIVRWTPETGVKELVSSGSNLWKSSFASVGEHLFFAFDDGIHGTELWRSDGTPAGTRMVADLHSGGSSGPTELTAVGDRLFFVATSARHGSELWEVDSAGSVRLVSDLAPGPLSSGPSYLTLAGDTLFFSADDGETGREPWALTLGDTGPGPPPLPPGPFLTSPEVPGFRFKVRITSQAGASLMGRQEPSCIPETLCVSGALVGRSEAFLRVVGPKPNGFLWPTLVKFSTSRVEIWVEQMSSGEVRYYDLAPAAPGFDVLPGLFDRQGFVPDSQAHAAGLRKRARADLLPVAARSGESFTSPDLPGFTFRVTVTDQQGHQIPVRVETDCIEETVCLSAAVPGRSELFLRVVGPKPNGYLWPTLVRFSTSTIDVWITQTATGVERHYRLDGASPGSSDLSGIFDRKGFLP